MSEYWVSQAKFYCKYCNIWIADNKPSRQNHDIGIKHKQSVDRFNREKREKALHGARSEADLKRQLADIERAANLAITDDRAALNGQFNRTQPPPPPLPQESVPPHQNFSRQDPMLSNQFSVQDYDIPDDLFDPNAAKEISSGIYKVRGQTYLEGAVFTAKFVKGKKCEVFLEDSDSWVPCVVEGRKEEVVPNTSATVRRFRISYSPSPDAAIVVEDSVRPDRLRLPVGEPDPPEASGAISTSFGAVAAAAAAARKKVEAVQLTEEQSAHLAAARLISEERAKGLVAVGGWQTISVTLVDEEKEREVAERLAYAQQEEDRQQRELSAKQRATELMRAAVANDDSVLAQLDPYGTQMYKGTFIGGDEILDTELPSLSNGKSIGFKKRKVTAVSNSAAATAAAVSLAEVKKEMSEIEAEDHAKVESKGSSSPSSNVSLRIFRRKV